MKPLGSEPIKKLLQTKKIGKAIHFFKEITSTNDVAFELARNGALDGTVVIADSQTDGRGRLQRKWISPPGLNLYISVILRPVIPAKDAPLFTLVSSVALAETIRNEGANPSIKWPNDIFIEGKKVAGVLTEMQTKGDQAEFVVVGIGVNINMKKENLNKEMREIAEIATSIGEATGRKIDRSAFTAGLINNLEKWYKKFQMQGRKSIIEEWMKMCGTINRRVKVKFNEKEIEGIACRVDENGYLVLRKDDGTIETIVAGDVIVL